MTMKKLFFLLIALQLSTISYGFTKIRFQNSAKNVTYETITDTTVKIARSTVEGDYTIPNSVTYKGKRYKITTIGDSAFFNCAKLTSLTIPPTVIKAEMPYDYAIFREGGSRSYFYYYTCCVEGCASLKKLYINSVKFLKDVYSYRSEAGTPTYDQYLKGIGTIFWGAPIEELYLDGDIQTVPQISIDRPKLSYSLNRKCIDSKLNIEKVILGENVIAIGDEAFYRGSSSLKTISGKNVKKIGASAFYGSRQLQNTFFPNLTEIGKIAFYSCKSLKEIPNYLHITTIGEYAFEFCDSISSVYLPNVTAIPSYAFDNCVNLTSVDLPNTKTIESSAFSLYKRLKYINLPKVETIGKSAFYTYYEMEDSITLILSDNAISSIEEKAFYTEKAKDTYYKKIIYLTHDVSVLVTQPFQYTQKALKNTILYVAKGMKTMFQKTRDWNLFSDIREIADYKMEDNVLSIYGNVNKENINALSDVLQSKLINTKRILSVDLTNAVLGNDIDAPTIKNAFGAQNCIYLTSDDASDEIKTSDNIIVKSQDNTYTCNSLVITDKSSFYSPIDFTAYFAKYTRDATNTWGTICLPFSIKSSNKVKLYKLSSITDDVMGVTEIRKIGAGEPAIYETSNSNLVISQINASITASNNKTTSGGYDLIGVVKDTVTLEVGTDNYYIAYDMFWKPTYNAVKVLPFRAYFTNINSNSNAYRILPNDNDPTGIESVDKSVENDGVIERYYDINGVRYNAPQKGVNIIRYSNGKTRKIIRK